MTPPQGHVKTEGIGWVARVNREEDARISPDIEDGRYYRLWELRRTLLARCLSLTHLSLGAIQIFNIWTQHPP
jgi:hypothetical protein